MSGTLPSPLLVFSGRRLWVLDGTDGVRIPTRPEAEDLLPNSLPLDTAIEVGWEGGARVAATRVAEPFDPPGGSKLVGIRSLHALVPETEFRLSGRALQLLDWSETHRFCGRCGTPTSPSGDHRAMRCPTCELLQFPRVAPAVIVLIHRGRELLLGRSARFPEGVYSTIAGFVEPGESLEEAVVREIFEETGVSVMHPAYFGSQPWPFPHSLMVGFLVEWESGDVELHDGELEDARWFPLDALPLLPTPMSIARWMIDRHLGGFTDVSAGTSDDPPPSAWSRVAPPTLPNDSL